MDALSASEWMASGAGEEAVADTKVDSGEDGSMSAREVALAETALTPAQAETALELIDGICADTWCSGDYDFGFRSLSCDRAAATCTLHLQVFPRASEGSGEQSYSRSCKTRGFDGYGSLVDGSGTGYESLNEAYYDALTACTTSIVEHLP